MAIDLRTLWYIGQPTREQAELVKAAKAKIDPGFLIKPTLVTDDAVGVALAFEKPDFPYLYGWADVSRAKSIDGMVAALRAIWYGEHADKLTTPAKWLSRQYGVEVTEIEEDF